MPGYYIVIIALSSLLFVGAVVFCVLLCCSRKRSKRAKVNYLEVPQVVDADIETKKPAPEENDTQLTNNFSGKQSSSSSQKSYNRLLDNVSNVNEVSAERSESDMDSEICTVSAYGDTGSLVSIDSKASWLTLNTTSNLNLSIQTSLIYAQDMRYVAGKIIQVEGLLFDKSITQTHMKVHVVVLPIKKYAIKTNWYEIRSGGKTKIDEYFKFVFKSPPSERRTVFRIRVYVRKMKMGALSRAECIGECYVNLIEIIAARGGLTIWRGLSRGLPQSAVEEAQ